MGQPLPTELAGHLEFLTPGMGLGEAADWELGRLLARGFVAAYGLTAYHAESTAAMSKERHIVEFCANDQERFGTLDLTVAWIGKDGGRSFTGIYAGNQTGESLSPADVRRLRDEEVRQVAYGWLGGITNRQIPGADITTAYRVGNEGRIMARARRRGPETRSGLVAAWVS